MSCGRLSPSRGEPVLNHQVKSEKASAGKRGFKSNAGLALPGRELGCLRLGKTALRVRYQAGQRLRVITLPYHAKDKKKPLRGGAKWSFQTVLAVLWNITIWGKRTGIDELANLLDDDG